MWQQIMEYLNTNTAEYFLQVQEHVMISLFSLLIACVVGVPGGYLCIKYKKLDKWIRGIFQILRILPSLAVLILLIPVMGTGVRPAMTALVLLAVPPILMNTAAGFQSVPEFMLETAAGLGMPEQLIFWKVKVPLAMPLVLTGIKTAMVEIIASATLAAYIGGGGLGVTIFKGLKLNRIDLLVLGGISVAVLSVTANILLEFLGKTTQKYKYKQ